MSIISLCGADVEMDLDCHGFPLLSQKNVFSINNAIENNSRYSQQFFNNNEDIKETQILAKDYIALNWQRMQNEKSKTIRERIIANILYRIDYENSTHLSSGLGIVQLTEKLAQKKYLYDAIKDPTKDINRKMIDEIGNFCIEFPIEDNEEKREKNKYYYLKSIVSKFFTYVNRHGYKDGETTGQYSIIDKVMIMSLPYYLKKAKPGKVKEYWNNLKDRGVSTVIKVKSYDTYYNLIGEILDNNEVNPDRITREELDRLLWYFFRKGSNRNNFDNIVKEYKRIIV